MSLGHNVFKKDPDKTFIVNYAPIFANLSPFEKNLIMQKSKVVDYKKGDIIYKYIDPADAFYCVITGRVKITGGTEKKETLEYLNCGKYFGVISLLTGEPHSVNAEAANDSKILRIDKDDFQVILNNIPKLAIDLSKTLSRRLRKKDTREKRIFESNIISVFSAVSGIGRTMYAINLSLSLKKETGKNVILIDLSSSANEVCKALGLVAEQASNDMRCGMLRLDTPFLTENAIKDAIFKEPVSGISILNIIHDSASSVYAANLNAILTQLTGDYHYIIVDLPALMDEVVFGALSQSDIINIITDYDTDNLIKTKALITDLFERVRYPQDKIKVVINARKESIYLPSEEVNKLLDYKVYALLPMLGEAEEKITKSASRVVLEEPHTEYAKAVRRIAREVGDVRVGLALSGGSAFGLVHIGVIKVLEKENIPIDVVVGSSIGALVGALWAVGLNSQELEKIALELNNNKKRVFRLLFDPCFPKLSFARGKRIKVFLETYLGTKTFQDIKFPLKILACNINKRQEVIFESGSLVDAILASIAIPGVFAPTKINNDLIVDGGVIGPVPIGTLVKMGIKKIIAVNSLPSPENIVQSYEFNLKRRLQEEKEAQSKGFFAKIIYSLGARLNNLFFPNILDIIVNSIQTMEYVIAENNCQRADVVIRPQAIGVDWFEFYKAEKLIKTGEEESTRSLANIRTLVSE